MNVAFDGAGHGEVDVVMDAQVLFDLGAPDDDGSAAPSKALLSDFLADELNLKITDETLVEINRDDIDERRNRSRQEALSSWRIVTPWEGGRPLHQLRRVPDSAILSRSHRHAYNRHDH